MAIANVSADPQVQANLSILHDIVGGYAPRDFAIRFWDGTTWDSEPGQPARFTLVLNHPGALRKMFWPPNILSPLQAYLYDD
ncbi:MAG: class I SAM-dependent methyltransferase, partial [Planctomycetes bacterium]|nr:class I SAM-dependent methyltransferase [Planctomycetota bacterium]